MDLNTLWFILITVLFIGFFFLEGFDYGVGTLLPFLGRNDLERRMIINTIGPVWDGNEVWLMTAGGAMFAAFPNWYATLFSGFYLALFLMLVTLIVRGVAFEFRSSDRSPKWRNFWDWMIFLGSAVPALLWGVAVSNLLTGVPIDGNMQYAGTFFDLLSPYTLIGGVALLLIFMLHGAIYLSLKTAGDMAVRAKQTAEKVGIITIAVVLLFAILTLTQTGLLEKPVAVATLLLAGVALIVGYLFVRQGKNGKAFIAHALSIVLVTVTVFVGMFPRVMISTLNPEWSLTIYNASSSPYTLKIMSIVALVFVPIVLAYTIWTYWVFRKRVTERDLHY